MDWGAKVELAEKIWREYFDAVGMILGVAQQLGVHRGMVTVKCNAVSTTVRVPFRIL